MKLNSEVIETVEQKLRANEVFYGIKVIYWCARGSILSGVYRENSDIDIVFLYKAESGQSIKAIHDILGYGFDLWGWEVSMFLKTIKGNRNMDGHYVISKEYRRANLTYYGGIFCLIGNETSRYFYPIKEKFERYLIELFDIHVFQKQMLEHMEKSGKMLKWNISVTACDYLNAVYFGLLAEYVWQGGLPGSKNIYELIESFVEPELGKIIRKLLQIYYHAKSKISQSFCNDDVNRWILLKEKEMKQVTMQQLKERSIERECTLYDLEILLSEI